MSPELRKPEAPKQAMKTRRLGKTEAGVSEFMFGCGNVGGIMIRADPDIMKSAVEKALAAATSSAADEDSPAPIGTSPATTPSQPVSG